MLLRRQEPSDLEAYEAGLCVHDDKPLNGTLYLGVTSDLVQRIYQHRNGLADGFTKQHGCKLLVWFECHDDLQDARWRELQIKKWKRDWKLRLIESENPD